MKPLPLTVRLAAGLAVTAAAVVVLGLVPGLLLDVARQAASFAG